MVIQLEASLAEDSLMIQSLLLPNSTTITQRLDLLMRAVQEQLNTTQGITDTFLQVHVKLCCSEINILTVYTFVVGFRNY